MGTDRLFHHFDMSTFAGISCRPTETALISIYCLPEEHAILLKVEKNPQWPFPTHPLLKFRSEQEGKFLPRLMDCSFDAYNRAHDLY